MTNKLKTIERKLIHLELSFDDGSIESLSGTEAQKWKKAVDAQVAYCWAHNMPFPTLKWDNKPKTESKQDILPYYKMDVQEIFDKRDEFESLTDKQLFAILSIKFSIRKRELASIFKNNNVDIKSKYPKIYAALEIEQS